jgi:L-aminopeptidase/D-esterase-like protein
LSLPALTVNSIEEAQVAVDQIQQAFNALGIYYGTGTPQARVYAGVGSIYRRLDGGAGTSLYVKEVGDKTTNTGWVGK